MVRIIAPAHVHAGNFDLSGDLGRVFGTIGFAIDIPIKIEVKEANETIANNKWAEKYAKLFAEKFNLNIKVYVESEVSPLAGLGYVTTVALAIGMGITKLYGLSMSLEDIATIARRGMLTALGLYAFKYGGFIVEGGFKTEALDKSIPPLIFRGEVPDDWRFVVAVPEQPLKNIIEMREKYEDNILQNLRRAPPQFSSSLCRIVLMKIIPSFLEKDLRGFIHGLWLLNSMLGEFWSIYQGSRYCCPIVEKGIEIMMNKAGGACQSSWGPTIYTIVGKDLAEELKKEMEEFLKGCGGGKVFCVKANNIGAVIYD